MQIKKKQLLQEILKVATDRIKHIRKPKYTNEYFVEMFIHVLDDVTSYKALHNMLKFKSPFHYKYIYNKWTKLDIFKEAYMWCSAKYIEKNITTNTLKLETYIDTTNINNKNSSEMVEYRSKKKEKICKLSLICDRNVGRHAYNLSLHIPYYYSLSW